MAKLSVIIPVFNHSKELALCLYTLENQTFKDFEVFVVDDGSEHPEEVKRIVEQSSLRVRLIRFDTNKGAPAARNEGFRHSKGDLVIFLDADIRLEPHAFKTMVEKLGTHPDHAFVYPSFYWGQKLFKGKPFDAQALKQTNYIHTSAMIRREAFPGFDEALRKFQDWDLFLTMAERGETGLWIPEPLYTIKPRKEGMSRWLPAFMYRIPWNLIGWSPKPIRRYREAEKVIQVKHGLPQRCDVEFGERFRTFFLGIFLIELLSLSVVFYPDVNSGIALALGFLFLVLSWKDPVFAITIIGAELVVGSKGALFKFGGDEMNNGGIPIRMILFTAFLIGWSARAIFSKRRNAWPGFLNGRTGYVILAALLLVTFIRGMLNRHPFVLADANNWGFLLLLLPALDLATAYKERLKNIFMPAMLAALFYVSLKTLFLFYFFSHDFGAYWEPLYLWVRRTGIAEVTRIHESSTAFRVFFQSHIYETLALVAMLASYASVRRVRNREPWLLALVSAVVLISFSRSFWLGVLAGVIVIAGRILLQSTPRKEKFAAFRRIIRRSFAPMAVGVLLVVGALFAPWPFSQGGSLFDLIKSRANIGEEAAVSRWSLLPVLWEKVTETPLFGHGFGATVTYQSSDPRIVQSTGGEYTTYAFEWGWIDFWIKFGILGIPIIVWLLYSLQRRFRRFLPKPWMADASFAVIITVAVIHFFTPYLNHPLGLGLLIGGEALLEYYMKPEE